MDPVAASPQGDARPDHQQAVATMETTQVRDDSVGQDGRDGQNQVFPDGQAVGQERAQPAGEPVAQQGEVGLHLQQSGSNHLHQEATGVNEVAAAQADAGSSGFHDNINYETPRSQVSRRSIFPSPISAADGPSPSALPRGLKWITGIGEYFNIRSVGESFAGPTFAAPLTGVRGRPTTPQYGAVSVPSASHSRTELAGGSSSLFNAEALQRLRAMEGSAPLLYSSSDANVPRGERPSSDSSDLPRDVIQQEVARQLGQLTSRVQAAEAENQQLRQRLTFMTEAPLLFQDWVHVTGGVAMDLSDSSGEWWGRLVEEIQKAYARWQSASAERTRILQALQDPGLTNLVSPLMATHQDLNFRLQCSRSMLHIDRMPTLEETKEYAKHILSEMEIAAAAVNAAGGPKLRALGQTTQPTNQQQQLQKQPGTRPACKYFMSDKGCRKGPACAYLHDMSSLDKAQRSRKCLKCGSTEHRQKQCPSVTGKPPVESPGGKAKGGAPTRAAQPTSPTSSVTPTSPASPVGVAQLTQPVLESTQLALNPTAQPSGACSLQAAASPIVEAASGLATSGAGLAALGLGGQTSGVDIAALDRLLEQAQAQLRAIQPQVGDGSPQGQSPKLNVMRTALMEEASFQEETDSPSALLDSGATHALRPSVSQREWQSASEVQVQLAGDQTGMFRMSDRGTSLNEPSSPTQNSQVIVPLGPLIEKLGYRLSWSRSVCKLQSPEGHTYKLRIKSGCPQLQEHEALKLITQLEQAKLQKDVSQLEQATVDTSSLVEKSRAFGRRTWFHRLMQYARDGSAESARLALTNAAWIDLAPETLHGNLLPDQSQSTGWQVLSGLHCLSRAKRRALHSSKNWVVHMYSGDRSNPSLQLPVGRDSVILNLDLRLSKSHDVRSHPAWQALVWGARNGRISHIVGSPPHTQFLPDASRKLQRDSAFFRTSGSQSFTAEEDHDNVKTFLNELDLAGRMLVLHALACAGRCAHRDKRHQSSDVGFLIEHPKVIDSEAERFQWDSFSFWDTGLWKAYQEEAGLATVDLQTAGDDASSVHTWTIGTNLGYFLHKATNSNSLSSPRRCHSRVWTASFRHEVSSALEQHRSFIRLCPMTREQWRQHLLAGHRPYNRQCASCVSGAGYSHQHRKIEHPSISCLNVDVIGPLRYPGLNPDQRGKAPRPFRYCLVGAYRFAKIPHVQGIATDEEIQGVLEESQRLQLEPTGERETASQDPLQEEGEHTDLDEYVPSEPEVDEDYLEQVAVPEEVEAAGVGGEDDDDNPSPGADASSDPLDRVIEDLQFSGESDTLLFAIPLHTNRNAEILTGLQEIAIWLRSHNCPVRRMHSDKSTEFFGKPIRQWCRSQGVATTYSEPGDPRSNGYIEGSVRLLKQKTRTLLHGSGLPHAMWPSAIMTVAMQQRGERLGMPTKLLAPFGHDVLAKEKRFHQQRADVDSDWKKYKYVGLSTTTPGAHILVRQVGERYQFMHTRGVRVGSEDPPNVFPPLQVDESPSPRRRIVGKSPAASIEAKGVQVLEEDLSFRTKLQAVLCDWDPVVARKIILQWHRGATDSQHKTGLFRRGGNVGVHSATFQDEHFTELLNRFFLHYAPGAMYTSLLLSGTPQELHMDSGNAPGTCNIVLPVLMPRTGGHHWSEVRPGDVLQGNVCEMLGPKGEKFFGTDGQQPNERSSGSAEGSEQVTFLHDVVGSVALALPLSSSGPHEVSFTALPSEAVYVRKIEQSFTRGIEAVLDGLTTPLGVVHLVDPGEARQHIDRWAPSLEKELAALEPAIQRFVQDDELHQQLQSRSDLIELPAKVVFTVKPPNQGALETETSMNVSSMSRQERETHLFRRKSRIVACGNMTEPSSWELYAAGATSEVLRIIIAETSFRAWALGVLDIVAAFLGTPMPPPDQFPPVVVRPPGVLRLRGLAGPRELWLLRRALYGLREAPRLWCLHRDRLLRLMTFETDEGLLCLKQSSGDENVWMLQSVDEEESEIKGYILVYVDDILLAMPLSLMRTVASKLQSTWDTSPLCVASREVPVKFLGLDVVAVDGGFFVTQETYVDELARIHNPHPPAVTPLTREECSFELTSSDIPPTPELTLECQQRAGELLWLSQRSRPDIAFTSALVSSLSTRAPARAIRVAQRALRYVASTRSSGILFVSHGDALDIYTDASFAPEGTKSHTGYAIFYR
eukprot:s9189_g1.t1